MTLIPYTYKDALAKRQKNEAITEEAKIYLQKSEWIDPRPDAPRNCQIASAR